MAVFAALAGAWLAVGAAVAEVVEIDVTASSIDRFDVTTPVGARYGKLTYLGGLHLKSTDREFGGLSGLRLSSDGKRFSAISDRGNWFQGTLSYEGTRLAGVSDVTKAPTPGRDGKPLPGRRGFDTEALEIEGRTAWIASERVRWLTRYTLGADGRPQGKGVAIPLPKAAAKSPGNAWVEAIAALPSGAIVIIGERMLDANGDNSGFVVGGKSPISFAVKRTDDFAPTDLTRLPDGDFVLLERRYKPPFSLSVRMRRLAARDISDGALIDGPVLMEASLIQTIDNFEAISAHVAPDGRTVLTILADDNFNFFERTLMLQFTVAE